MNIFRYLYPLVLCLFVSCVFDNTEDVLVEEIELGNDVPYEDTSTFIKAYSENSFSTIQIGSQKYNVPKYNVFPKIPELRPFFSWPIIERTKEGTMLVVCTNRHLNYEDIGEMDILLARKEKETDNWEIRRIFQMDSLKGRAMCPALVVDSSSGRIYLIANYFEKVNDLGSNHTNNEVTHVYKYSDDDGLTWSKEYDLKHTWSSFYTQLHDEYAMFGGFHSNQSYESKSLWSKGVDSYANIENIICVMFGHGIDKDGTLLIPSSVIMNGIWYSTLLIRENGCWRYSQHTPNPSDGECTVYLDNENRIVLDCRTDKPTTRRKYYYDIVQDEFIETTPSKIGSYVRCYAEIVNDDGLYYMCFPDSPNDRRENLTFYGSLDGINWRKIFLVNPSALNAGSAYSSIALKGNKLFICSESPEGIFVLDISACREAIRYEILNN